MGKLLSLQLLGGAHIALDGVPLHALSSAKARALLIYLAVTHRSHSRDALAGLLWPDMANADARINLRQALTHLRRLLPEHLSADRYELSLSGNVTVDVHHFESLLAEHRAGNSHDPVPSLRAAVELYKGDFLEGFFAGDAEPFEEWLLPERERLRGLMVDALHRLAQTYTIRRQISAGLHYTGLLLAMDPWCEEAYRQRMRLLAWDGQVTSALAQYNICKEALQGALGLAPQLETTQLYERILALRHGNHRTLPLPQARFVGRTEELQDLAKRLHDPTCRLLTITGPGGIGKTALALQAADGERKFFLDGVFWLELTSLGPEDDLSAALARVMGLSFHGTQSLAVQLHNHLRGREVLLVLDNFEHLLAGVPSAGASGAINFLTALLADSPHLKVLVTSRERLNLAEEWLFALEGLPFPATEEQAQIEHYESVQLFLQMAQRFDRRFHLHEQQAAVVQICRLVQGMPLALCLAAARLPEQPATQIAADLAAGLAALATSTRNVPLRQQSLTAALDDSWRPLSSRQRQHLAAFSVFRDGFSAEAATAIAGIASADLSALVSKSWLQHRNGRYSLHEVLRRYVAELPENAAAITAATRRHCDYYLAFVARQEAALDGPEMAAAIDAIQTELGNVRAAWQWAITTRHLPALTQCLDGLTSFYAATNQYGEGERLIRQAVTGLDTTPPGEASLDVQSLLACLLTALARLLLLQRHYQPARQAAQSALVWADYSQRTDLIAQNTLLHGAILYQQGEYAQARTYIDDGLALAEGSGLPHIAATGWQYAGSVDYFLANYSGARTAYAHALTYYEGQAPRFPRQRAGLLNNLGNVYLRLGDFDHAWNFYQQAMALRRHPDGSQMGGIVTINNLGLAALGRHRYTEALAYFEKALDAYRKLGHRQGESMVLGNMADFYLHMGVYEQASLLARQEMAILQEIGSCSRLGMPLVRLGAVHLELGDGDQASGLAQQAVEQASLQGEQDIAASAFALLGHSRLKAGEYDKAAAAYRRCLDLRNTIGQQRLVLEPLAGLAVVHFRCQEQAAAQRYAGEILHRLENAGEDYTPLIVYVNCHHVLAASDGRRARAVATRAHRLLQARAATIDDQDLRHSFLHNITAHRTVAALNAQ